jgi:DNA-binding transcriptional ArsR family regulator
VSSIGRLLSRGASGKSAEPEDPDVIAIDDGAADEVLSALSSGTAREILSRLYQEPGTASGVAGDVDTSLQNANYHLTNLTEIGLIEVRDVRYSDQGKEMYVYAPTNRALVLFASEDVDRSSLFETVKRLLLPVGALAIVSVAVDVALRRILLSPESPTPTGTGVSFDGTGVDPAPISSLGDLTGIGVSPGAIFFVGGLLALFILTFLYRDRPASW